MKETSFEKIRRLEERLVYADPKESAKITKEIVRLKSKWIEE